MPRPSVPRIPCPRRTAWRRWAGLAGLLLGLGLGSSPALALALGPLQLQSSLGQPLRAELAFEAISAEESATLQPRLASPEAHRARGLDHPSDLMGLQFSLVPGPEGRPVLRLEGQRPLREPVLGFLLELRWQGGRLLRAYELLVDPPGWPLAAQPDAAAGATPDRPTAEPGPPAPPQAAWIEPRGLGLLAIARRHAPPGTTPAQMAWALLEANPEAFDEGRMERLRPGVRLRRPEPAAVAAIDPARAAQRLALAFPQPAPAALAPPPAAREPLRAGPTPLPVPAPSPLAPREAPTLEERAEAPPAAPPEAPPAVPASAPPAPASATAREAPPSAAPARAAVASPPRADPEAEPWTLGLGGPDLRVLAALLLLLLGALGWRAWRRRPAGSPSGPTVFSDSALAPATRAAAGGAGPASRAPAGLGFGLSQLDAGGDLDPVAEADVYLAYGRDLQAEDILRAALQDDPGHSAVHRKLLEILAQRHDARGFAAQARQMQLLAGESGPDWLAVLALGRSLEPPWTPEAAAAGSAAPVPAPPAPSPAAAAAAATTGAAPSSWPALAAAVGAGAGAGVTPGAAASGASAAAGPEAAGVLQDLDLDLSQPAASWMPSRPEAEALPPLDFDAPSTLPPEPGPDPAWARRLAMAEEFLRIEDPDGARELLEGEAPPADPGQLEALRRLRMRLG